MTPHNGSGMAQTNHHIHHGNHRKPRPAGMPPFTSPIKTFVARYRKMFGNGNAQVEQPEAAHSDVPSGGRQRTEDATTGSTVLEEGPSSRPRPSTLRGRPQRPCDSPIDSPPSPPATINPKRSLAVRFDAEAVEIPSAADALSQDTGQHHFTVAQWLMARGRGEFATLVCRSLARSGCPPAEWVPTLAQVPAVEMEKLLVALEMDVTMGGRERVETIVAAELEAWTAQRARHQKHSVGSRTVTWSTEWEQQATTCELLDNIEISRVSFQGDGDNTAASPAPSPATGSTAADSRDPSNSFLNRLEADAAWRRTRTLERARCRRQADAREQNFSPKLGRHSQRYMALVVRKEKRLEAALHQMSGLRLRQHLHGWRRHVRQQLHVQATVITLFHEAVVQAIGCPPQGDIPGGGGGGGGESASRSRSDGLESTPQRTPPHTHGTPPPWSTTLQQQQLGQPGRASVFERLTDPRDFTGHHRHRFDQEGNGLGFAGRDTTKNKKKKKKKKKKHAS
jgi:hypothetical protein